MDASVSAIIALIVACGALATTFNTLRIAQKDKLTEALERGKLDQKVLGLEKSQEYHDVKMDKVLEKLDDLSITLRECFDSHVSAYHMP